MKREIRNHLRLYFKETKSLRILGLVSFCIILLTTFTELNINKSQSVIGRVFLTLKKISPQKGELVTINNHPSAYYPNVVFTKRLIAKEGDHIKVSKGTVFVNDKPVASLKEKTLKGEPLTPIQAQIIPYGYIFVLGDHERSFDSRYEEFGLVRTDHISGKALLLW